MYCNSFQVISTANDTSSAENGSKCEGTFKIPSAGSLSLLCNEKYVGRYVTIRNPGNKVLTLCEVGVYLHMEGIFMLLYTVVYIHTEII